MNLPELWWSPTVGVIGRGPGGLRGLGYGAGLKSWIGAIATVPDDAVPLAPTKPVVEADETASFDKAVAEFDGGPLHEADLYVRLVNDRLPEVVVTDAGDFWVTYVLTAPKPDELMRRYRYAGDATDSERRRCVYVDDNDVPDIATPT